MSNVIQVVLSNARHPEYGQFTIPFPIPQDAYDDMVEALKNMEIGDPILQDCHVDELESSYSILKRLEKTNLTGVTGKTPASSWPHKMRSFWNCIPRSQTPRRSPRRTPLRQTPPLIPAKPQKRRRPQAPRRWPDAELQESRHFLPRGRPGGRL